MTYFNKEVNQYNFTETEDTLTLGVADASSFVFKVMELARDGYTYIEGSASVHMMVKQAAFNKPAPVSEDLSAEGVDADTTPNSDESESDSTPTDIDQIVNGDPTDAVTFGELPEPTDEIVFGDLSDPIDAPEVAIFDLTLAKSFKGKQDSKKTLEAYGLTFGIDLNRSKTFDNMLKTLEAHVEAS